MPKTKISSVNKKRLRKSAQIKKENIQSKIFASKKICKIETIIISSDDDDFRPKKILKKEKLQSITVESQPATVTKKVHKIFQIQPRIKDKNKPLNIENDESELDPSLIITNKNIDDDLATGNSKYYHENFLTLLDYVLNNEQDRSLFCDENCNDLFWAETFKTLPIKQQLLYSRLFHRKNGWIHIDKINYPDICHTIDRVKILKNLADKGYLFYLPNALKTSKIDLNEILSLLPLEELKILAKELRLNEKQRKMIIPAILKLSKKQKCIFASSMQQSIINKIAKFKLPFFKVATDPKRAFNRFLLVFDVTRGIDDDIEGSCSGSVSKSIYKPYNTGPAQLSNMMLTGMGRIKYPEYIVDRPSAIFGTREHLLEFESASQLYNDVCVHLEVKRDFEAAKTLSLLAKDRFENQNNDLLQFVQNLPTFLQCFTAPYMDIKSLIKLVDIHEKTKNYIEAVDVIKYLLKQSFCVGHRGRLWERLSLNLHQHLKNPSAAADSIICGIADDHVRVGHKLALANRMDKILSAKNDKNNNIKEKYEKEIKNVLVHLEYTKCPEITISGKQLKLEQATGMTSRFVIEKSDQDEFVVCSVEEVALDHYRTIGYDKGLHAEGRTFFTLLCLLFWDIIFMPGFPDVFRTEYQTHPLDFYTDDFYEKRKPWIDERLKLIKECDASVKGNQVYKIIEETWNNFHGVACAGITWNVFGSIDHLWSLVECLGCPILSQILERMIKDTRRTRSGIPDLIVWNTEEKTHKFSEVKGPGDRLSTNQILWLHELLSYGADAEVCYVKAVAAKSKLTY